MCKTFGPQNELLQIIHSTERIPELVSMVLMHTESPRRLLLV